MICSPVHNINKFEVDSGKNSDESFTNNETTFSCDKCGQNFGSQQELKNILVPITGIGSVIQTYCLKGLLMDSNHPIC